jgi:hypothetical protein
VGLLDAIKRPMYKSRWQRPWDSEAIIQILAIEFKGGDMAVLDALDQEASTGLGSTWRTAAGPLRQSRAASPGRAPLSQIARIDPPSTGIIAPVM